MTSPVALVTGGSSGIGESTARALLAKGFVVYAVARRVERMAPLSDLGATHVRDGRHRRRLDGRRHRPDRRRAGAHRPPGQQRRLRLVRRRRGRADRRGTAAVRGQRLRPRPPRPARHPPHAHPEVGPDHQHLLDRREVLRAVRRVVPRHQVRGGGLQRQPPHGAAAVRHPGRADRARPDPHRVERDRPRLAARAVRRRPLRVVRPPRPRRHGALRRAVPCLDARGGGGQDREGRDWRSVRPRATPSAAAPG